MLKRTGRSSAFIIYVATKNPASLAVFGVNVFGVKWLFGVKKFRRKNMLSVKWDIFFAWYETLLTC